MKWEHSDLFGSSCIELSNALTWQSTTVDPEHQRLKDLVVEAAREMFTGYTHSPLSKSDVEGRLSSAVADLFQFESEQR